MTIMSIEKKREPFERGNGWWVQESRDEICLSISSEDQENARIMVVEHEGSVGAFRRLLPSEAEELAEALLDSARKVRLRALPKPKA
jgi:hypothetical protein